VVNLEREDGLNNYVTELIDSVDIILFGREMADGFIFHWINVLDNGNDLNFSFARKMIEKPKVVFTKTLDKYPWDNTRLPKEALKNE
jgi:hypothetical protein